MPAYVGTLDFRPDFYIISGAREILRVDMAFKVLRVIYRIRLGFDSPGFLGSCVECKSQNQDGQNDGRRFLHVQAFFLCSPSTIMKKGMRIEASHAFFEVLSVFRRLFT